ncbi:MAG: helix-turn-helix transcriptional regulator [Hydrococcus sp. C42_A2020_068]|uniref:winged helix-turn-helix transcriptional regulator n=1 Tax=Pleurocapsa sp. PCC 7327 TaxID=118163 RepID=UPI0002FBB038|nr:winged helix-turn-helix transcriptional regulator [Pleurocapsa sp. PCC 7327]MBF2020407.1 helix-turn-helix transcriptional regulator [Hydrococcus sp. C42_A2020_068]
MKASLPERERGWGEGDLSFVTQPALRNLERHGIVERKVYLAFPSRVEYSLMPLGETSSEPLGCPAEWSQTHISVVREASDRYDNLI